MTKIYLILKLILFIYIVYVPIVYSQQNDYRFDHLSVENGLSQSTINCIFQDSKGFMWFGTQDGLNKYDGYTFEVFKHNPMDTNSISHNWIWAVFEDSSGNLWIATWWGLNKYEPSTNRITRYLPNKNNPNSINNDRPTTIGEDGNGKLWIGTWGGGLNIYDPESDSFRNFKFDVDNVHSLSNNFIRTLFRDDQGIFWIGTWDGLCSANSDSLKKGLIFTRYYSDPEDRTSLSGNKVVSIQEDDQGNLLIGTMENGLNRLNLKTKKFTRFMYNPKNKGSISSNGISAILKDSFGNLWIATQDYGLNRYSSQSNSFIRFMHDPGDEVSLSSNKLNALFEDKSGVLWIGTGTNGLNKLNLRSKRFSLFRHSKTSKNSLSSNLVRSFFKDQKGYLWIGTAESGIDRFDSATGQFIHFQPVPGNRNSISHENIQAIVGDNKGNLWIGTFGGGLNRFETATEKFIHFKHDPQNDNNIGSNYIETLLLDGQGSLWIGTSDKGLDRYWIDSGRFEHYKFDPKDRSSISTNYILSLFQDSRGNLWIGGWGGGLNQFDRENKKFIRYLHDPSNPTSLSDNIVNVISETKIAGNSYLWVGTAGGLSYMNLDDTIPGNFNHLFENDGLPNQHIYGILKDKQGNLWCSTNKGLSKFTPFKKFKNYDSGDGLPSDEFSGGAYYQSKDGQFYFGCPNGFVTFYPDSIRDNQFIPPVVITKFKKFNRDYDYQKHISILNELDLSYKDYVFSFEFSALDYTAPEKNQYAYKMEGFNQNWISVDSRNRSATFTNLDPGKYVFKVKGSNSDGIWNETGVAINIFITPPFWKTWWFRLIIGFILVCMVSLAHFYRVRHLKLLQKNQIEFSDKLIESQEAERKRIAAELHDSLGQNLLIANNELQQLLQDRTNLGKDLDGLSAIIKESIDEIREISHNLHPHLLDRLGITKAIESMINKMSHASDIKFNLEMENIDRLLTKESEIHYYRIIQEAVNNIVKHSQANSCSIVIKKSGNQIHAIIEDNGKGFHTGISMKKGMGLRDMEERTRLISGNFHVTSKPGSGTKININIPISKKA